MQDSESFFVREIDTVRVRGKQDPAVLYEVFDMDEPELRRGKVDNRQTFAQAMAAFKKGDFQKATELFEKCKELAPNDPLLAIYMKRCQTMLRVPPGEGWQGVSGVI